MMDGDRQPVARAPKMRHRRWLSRPTYLTRPVACYPTRDKWGTGRDWVG